MPAIAAIGLVALGMAGCAGEDPAAQCSAELVEWVTYSEILPADGVAHTAPRTAKVLDLDTPTCVFSGPNDAETSVFLTSSPDDADSIGSQISDQLLTAGYDLASETTSLDDSSATYLTPQQGGDRVSVLTYFQPSSTWGLTESTSIVIVSVLDPPPGNQP